MMVNRISVFYAGEMNPLTNEHRMPAACGEVLEKNKWRFFSEFDWKSLPAFLLSIKLSPNI